MSRAIESAFAAACEAFGAPEGEVEWCYCQEADREHRQSARQFMHTFHRRSRDAVPMICVARAARGLGPENLVALFAHELGHIVRGPEASEEAADEAASVALGAPVSYDRHAVQTVDEGTSRRAALRRRRRR